MKHSDPMEADRQQAEANAILDNPPDGLLKWLESEGLSMADADRNPDWTYGGMATPLRVRGLLETMENWRKEQAPRFAEDGFGITNRQRVAAKVIYRFAAAKAKQWKGNRLSKRKDAELDVLPKQLRWVYENPKLHPDYDPDALEWRTRVEAYERTNPAPGQGAQNYLAHCLADSKICKSMFDDVRTFLLAARRQSKELPDKTDKAGQQQILDMREQLAKKQKAAV